MRSDELYWLPPQGVSMGGTLYPAEDAQARDE